MKQKKSILFLLFVFPLWLVAAFLILEIFYNIHGAVCNAFVINPAIAVYRAADDEIFQRIHAASPPPDATNWNAPDREAFWEIDESERFEFAEKRRETILVCDLEGVVIHAYPCHVTPELALISERIKEGESIEFLFPPAEWADLLTTVRAAASGETPHRDYKILLDLDKSYLAEIAFYPLSKRKNVVVLFIGDSRYETFSLAYRPNVYRRNWYKFEFNDSVFWTNSLGFRDREICLPKPDGIVRIVCIGGSTTVEGPHNALTYPKLLEQLLCQYFNTESIEVINCGVDGLAFPGEYLRIDDWLALEPDIIVHYNIINNAGALVRDAIEYAAIDNRTHLATTLEHLIRPSAILSSAFGYYLFPDIEYYTRVLYESPIHCLIEISHKTQESGISLAVAGFAVPDADTLSNYERFYFDNKASMIPVRRGNILELRRFINEYNGLVKEFCADYNALYIPVAEELTGGVETFADSCHLRLSGIHKKAQIMFTHLKDEVGVLLKKNTHTDRDD